MMAPGAQGTVDVLDGALPGDAGARVAARVAAIVMSKSSLGTVGFYTGAGGAGKAGRAGRWMMESRRDFLRTVGVLGAGTVACGVPDLLAQAPARSPGRIDVHHHVTPPKYLAELASRNLATPDMTGWSVARTLDDMDKAGVRTAIVSITS